ncbi:MAG: hypothetical protein ACRENU_11685 [Gemmatimonadaceae bacterium]
MRKKLSDLLLRFRNLVVEYGVIAIVVHYIIFGLVIVGFWAAMRTGWEPTSAAGSVGTWTAAYVATKVTQPLRIIATLALTPFIARIYERVTGRSARLVDPTAESGEPRAS